MKSLKEIIEVLNSTDESVNIEVKRGVSIDKSTLESVCAFANEPALGGGIILLGVTKVEDSLFPSYEVTGVDDPDKLQMDLSSQCASMFSLPIRPTIRVEELNGKRAMVITINELAEAQKPLYFKKEGLPKGAWRRIGSTDQRCTDDDLAVFYQTFDSFDQSIIEDTSLKDTDDAAIEQYRRLRSKVNENADELEFDDPNLLLALNCAKKVKGELRLTYAGLLLFGSKMAHRRLIPAVRVDYIRVPGSIWIENPDNRFTTVDMRGSLLLILSRIYNSVVDDLPKGFLLPEGELQAESVGLPGRVLREALVNALMHRSYRENQPIQIIRYSNRIEIRNPGFSLKSDEHFGDPGSQQRNPFIAAVFHETNLAETKGSGIRTMRKLMDKSGMAPPTFESDHSQNTFTTRLLLHHFLSEFDLVWLRQFDYLGINDNQKKALIFIREVGAIDNPTYRQLSGEDVLKASQELRSLKNFDLLFSKGKSRATYYVAGALLQTALVQLDESSSSSSASAFVGNIQAATAPPNSLTAPPQNTTAPPQQVDLLASNERALLLKDAPKDILAMLDKMGKRTKDKSFINGLIVRLCRWKFLKASEIAIILAKSEKWVLREYITLLIQAGELQYTIPDMKNHPDQAYIASAKEG